MDFDIDELIKQTQKLKVLYVEDNKDARESTMGLLKNIFSDITTAVDGRDGLDKFHESGSYYNLVISDINMPNMNGIEMVTAIKKSRDDVRVCLISAYDSLEYPIDQNLNIDVRLSKPIDFNDFFISLASIYSINT